MAKFGIILLFYLIYVGGIENKDQLIEDIIQLGSRTGQFSASKGKDTDVFIEHKIVEADYYEPDGSGEEKIERMYRAYVLLDETSHEAKYNEEIYSIVTG